MTAERGPARRTASNAPPCPSSPRRPRLRRAALGLGACAALGSLACQAPTPRRAPERPIVRFTDRKGYLEVEAARREQDQRSKVGTGDTRSKETTFQEKLQLEVAGFSYHPNLLDFTASAVFGLLQHDFQVSAPDYGISGSDDGTLLEFDFTGQILKKKPYPGTVYARRTQGLEPRLFRSSVETTVSEYGVLWHYLHDRVPTSFQFQYTDVQLDPLATQEEPGRREDTGFRFETGYIWSEHNRLKAQYEHEIVSERPNVLDYDSDELTLTHRLDFGRDQRHRLDSELYYYRQQGTFDVERLRWRENLWLKHSDTLRSVFRFEAEDRTHGSLTGLPTLKERSYYFSGMLEHRLYLSLVSQLHGFAQFQDFESGTSVDRYGVDGSLDYRKTNPFGVLRASYRLAFEREDRSGQATQAEVLDEAHTFRDPEPVRLNSPRINLGSIVVTAADGFTYYLVGRDYNVRRVGDHVELERIVTGRIADGETVLVDYTFDLGGNFALDTVRQDFSLRQDFDFGLSPYYRFRWQDQSVSPSGARGAVPEDIQAHVLGAEYRWRTFRVAAEYEDHDSNINPFEALRFHAGYSHRFRSGALGSLRAGWSRVTYGYPQDRRTRFFSVEGRYRHPLTPTLTVEGAVLYRDGEDSLSGPHDGIDVDLSLEWFIRQTEIRITYEYGRYEDSFAQNDSSTIYFLLRRRF